MPGGGTQDIKQESSFRPSPEQQEIIGLALPYIRQFAGNPPPAPTGTAIAPFNATQQSAQQNLLGIVPQMAQYGQQAAQGNQFLFSGDVLRPESNPALQATINAATEPIMQNATQQLLPQVRSQAAQTGQYGGSRQALAEGAIGESALRQVGNTAANVATEGYTAGLDAMGKGIALAPQMQQNLAAPYALQNSVGDVQQGMTQAQTSEQYQQARMAEMWPALLAQEIMGQQSMLPGGTNVTEGEQPGPSLFQQLTSGLGVLGSLFGFLL